MVVCLFIDHVLTYMILSNIFFFIFFFSPLLFRDSDFGDIVIFFMEYAAAVSHIREDIYYLIQRFFNQIYIFQTDDWDAFWIRDTSGYIRIIHQNLLKKLDANLKTPRKDDDIKRTNAMLVKLCLMTFHNYQLFLRSMFPNPTDFENITQTQIIRHLFIIFQHNYGVFDLNDEHFAMQLNRFYNKNTVPKGRNKVIAQILQQ